MPTPIPESQLRSTSQKMFFGSLVLAGIYALVVYDPDLTKFLLERPVGKSILFWGKLILMLIAMGGIIKAGSLIPIVFKGSKVKKIKFWIFEADLNTEDNAEPNTPTAGNLGEPE